ncbi:MAG: RIP metalloprotease RseP [Bacteroidota bacterium]
MTQALQLLLSLSILIVLHELGHFIPAKLFKTRVEKFYLFFDPWFSLFKIRRGETEYGIGWLPLGGYVKIAGMIDESMDKEQMKKPPEPWEFRSKPAWQRLIIMIGGVTVNLVLGIIIYAMVLFVWGEKYLPAENAKYGIHCDSLALEIGLKNGDHILAVDGQKVDNFDKIAGEMILNTAPVITVKRGDSVFDLPVPDSFYSKLIAGKNYFIEPRYPCEVDSVVADAPAGKAGLQKGDKIVSLNGQPAAYFQEVASMLKQNKGKEVELTVIRAPKSDQIQQADTLRSKLTVTDKGTLGFYNKSPDKFFQFNTYSYGFFESFPAGIKKGTATIVNYVKQLKVLFTVEDAHQSLGGFITIAKGYGDEWNWQRFWSFTAFISIVLAIMNILPIPALDGGHVMFLLWEMVTGRKASEKVLEYAQYAGMLLLLALLVYANGNDIARLFTGG